MSRTQNAVAIAVAALLCLPVFALVSNAGADDAARRGADVKRPKKAAAATPAALRGGSQQHSHLRKPQQPLGKTVKLTFKMTGEEEQPTFPVVCAARDFLIEHDASEADGSHQMKIAGTLLAVDDPHQVLVTFSVMHYHANDVEGANVTFKLEGSAQLRLGQKVSLGNVGDQPLELSVELLK